MDAQKYIWMDGKLTSWGEANVHFLTHSLHYGTGVFEGIRFYKTPKGPAVFRLNDHINRLYDSAEVFGMGIPFSKIVICKAIMELIRANGLEEGYIRPLVYLGDKMGLNPVGAPVKCGIAVWPWGAYLGKTSVKAIISKYIRVHPRSGEMSAKISGVYYNSAMASLEAHRAGVDEAILLDYEGYVAEGPGENIFIVKRQSHKLITPPAEAILPGITRKTVIAVVNDLKESLSLNSVEERKFTPEELKSSDEAFFTGTAVEITAVKEVNGEPMANGMFEGMGPVTFLIKNLYDRIVRGLIKEYEHWLTYVN